MVLHTKKADLSFGVVTGQRVRLPGETNGKRIRRGSPRRGTISGHTKRSSILSNRFANAAGVGADRIIDRTWFALLWGYNMMERHLGC
jgi:hypothetical protein